MPNFPRQPMQQNLMMNRPRGQLSQLPTSMRNDPQTMQQLRQAGVKYDSQPTTPFLQAQAPQAPPEPLNNMDALFRAGRVDDAQAMSRQMTQQANEASTQNLLKRMGHTGFGVNRWGDPRAQGIASSILDFYRPGHAQYEAALQQYSSPLMNRLLQ